MKQETMRGGREGRETTKRAQYELLKVWRDQRSKNEGQEGLLKLQATSYLSNTPRSGNCQRDQRSREVTELEPLVRG